MRDLTGTNVIIYFKDNKEVVIDGILIIADEKELYVQNCSNKICVVPRENILYFSTDSIPSDQSKFIDVKKPVVSLPVQEERIGGLIKVFVDSEFITEIATVPTFDLGNWNDNIYRIVASNHDVKQILQNRVQKSLTYVGPQFIGGPAEVNIETYPVEEEKKISGGQSFQVDNISTQYLSQAQLATLLNPRSK